MEEDIVQQHLQQLKHKQHIEGIDQVAELQYNIAYSPQLTNSPYSHLCFRVKVILQHTYPQSPPSIAFLDKVYHLNIDSLNGEVHMPILTDDWSPYLTLAAIFDSLDNLLEQPDIDYAASKEQKEEYMNEPDKYVKKIEQTIKAYSSIIQANNQSVAEHVNFIKESKGVERQSEECYEASNGSNSGAYFKKISEVNSIPLLAAVESGDKNIRIETLSDIPYQNQLESSKYSNKQEAREAAGTQISLFQQSKGKQNHSSVSPASRFESFMTSERKTVPLISQFDKIQQSLKKADSLVELLMCECDSMQGSIKRTQSQRLRQKLSDKQKRIMQMLDQTLELSSSLREKLFFDIKHSADPLLK